MKRFFLLLSLVMMCVCVAMAQAPEKMTYQAVVRNSANSLVANQNVTVRLSILLGSAQGAPVYVENHTAATNDNGLMTVEIGGGAPTTGVFANIDWANGPYFLKSEIDPTGGINYSIESVQQLMSVPYALYAKEAGNGFSGDYNDLTNKPTFTESQILSISNDTIYLTGGSFVKLPAGFDGDYNSLTNKPNLAPVATSGSYNDITGKPNLAPVATSGNYNDLTNRPQIPQVPTNVSAFTNDAGYITMDSIPAIPAVPTNVGAFTNDAGYITQATVPTNVSAFTNDAGYLTSFTEQQILTINNDTIYLTGGSFVKLPAGFDGDYNSLTNRPNLAPVATSGSYNDITGKPNFAPVATSGEYNDLTGKPNLAPVATSGNYNDLTNRPQIPTNVSAFTNDAGYITMDSVPAIPTIPTNVSAFTNDAGYITQAAVPTHVSQLQNDAGYLTSFTEQQILSISNDTIYLTGGSFVKLPAGFDGDYNSLTNKPTIPLVPTNVSAFTNDAGYITQAAVPTNVSQLQNDAGYITKDSIPSIPTIPTNVSAFTNDAGYLTSFTEQQILSISNDTIYLTGGSFVKLPAGFDGDYNSLTNKPTIPIVPTDVSAFTNDAGYITQAAVPTNVSQLQNDAGYITSFTEQQILSISNDTIYLTGGSYVKLPAGFDGDYNSLTNKPTIPIVPTDVSAFTNDAGYITQAAVPTNMSQLQNDAGYLTSFTEQQILSINNDTIYLTGGSYVKLPAGFDGDYNCLTNKPTIPIVPTDVSAFTNDAGYITMDSIPSIPTIPTNVSAFQNDAGYLTSFTEQQILTISNDTIYLTGGSYVKLPAGFDGDYNSLTNRPNLAPVATSGSYNDITGKPNFAPVATSGNYNDLTNRPQIPQVPTNVSAFNNDAGYITQAAVPTNVSQLQNDAGYITSFTEQQILSISNDTIYLTGGSYVKLPAGFDGDYNSLTNKPTNVSAFTNDAGYITSDSLNNLNNQLDSLQHALNNLQQVMEDDHFLCGTSSVTDVDGNTYNTVRIGEQCWMKENLRTTHYSDGTFIELGDSSRHIPFRYAPDNNQNNVTSYGYLYNWPAVMHGEASSNSNPSGVQGICPIGWHVPSDAEWTQLTDYVSGQAQYLCEDSSNYIAKALAATIGWNSSTGICDVGNTPMDNNSTGFMALPAGIFYSDRIDSCLHFGSCTVFGSSTKGGPLSSFDRTICYDFACIKRSPWGELYGRSVRCLRDNTSVSEQIDAQQHVLDSLAPVAFSGDYNDLINTPPIPAEQVNADWNATSGKAEILNKPTNVSAFANDAGYITMDSIPAIPTIPTNVSAFINDAGYVTVANVQQAVNIPANVSAFTNDAGYITMDSIPSIPTIPTNVSAFQNDAGYLTSFTEQQILTISNDTIYLTGGSFVKLPAGFDGDYNSLTNKPTNVSAFTNDAEYVNNNTCDTIDFCSLVALVSNLQKQVAVLQSTIDSLKIIDTTGGFVPVDTTVVIPVDTCVYGIPCPNNPTVTDYDGNVYNTVLIGTQCWMKENLRTTHFADGVNIPSGNISSSDVPLTSSDSAYRYNPNKDAYCVNIYGHLYNKAALMYQASSSTTNPSDVQGVCPNGWHVPSDAEWTQLMNYVGKIPNHYCGIAKALASTSGWKASTDYCAIGNRPELNNITGFDALPAGTNSASYSFGGYAVFGSATTRNIIRLSYSTSTIKINAFDLPVSVRCLLGTGFRIPSVKTITLSDVDSNSAICNGEVLADGGVTVTAHGVCWSTFHNPTLADSYSIVGGGIGSFSSVLTGLQSGTTYFVRAYATNNAGTNYGAEISFTTLGASPSEQPCPGVPFVSDVDGNAYNTVQIGNQCWMKENLRTTRYADGTPISLGDSLSLIIPYRYYPNNNSANITTLGYYYNWTAVMHGANQSTTNPSGVQGICPTGWHVPSDSEWCQLVDYLGSDRLYVCGGDSTYIAKALASTSGWKTNTVDCTIGNNEETNNSSGFSALPIEYDGDEHTIYLYNGADFWTATQYNDYYAYSRRLNSGQNNVERNSSYKRSKWSVRCLRDSVVNNEGGGEGGGGTQAVLPTVITVDVSGITANTATCGGNVTADGGAAVTARGVCWSTSQNPTISDSHTTDGSGTGSFTSSITGLSLGTTYYVRAYATNREGTAYGAQRIFTTRTTVPSFFCGTSTVSDHEGNVYHTVQIGNQCWTKENLRTTTSPSTGTNLIPASGTASTLTGKQARWYNNDSTTYAPMNYGLLYNWNAAVDTFNTACGETSVNDNWNNAVSVTFNGHRKGICPEGWHLPSNAEWIQLTNYVSGRHQYVCGDTNRNIAKALADPTGWNTSTDDCAVGNNLAANNTTGFSAFPAGQFKTSYSGIGYNAIFWSATQKHGYDAYNILLSWRDPDVNWKYDGKSNGFSVRCLRDDGVTSSVSAVIDSNSCPNTPTVTDHEGNVYATVQIGAQCWMRENLRTTTSPSTGTLLIPNTNAAPTYTGKQARWYSNDPTTYAPMGYGLLYNWNAAVDTFNTECGETSVLQSSSSAVSVTFNGHRRGICPEGWHLPSDEEWTQLIDYMSSQYEYVCGDSNINIAKALADSTGWTSSTGICAVGNDLSANNATGFSARGAGEYVGGSYFDRGSIAYLWSSTQSGRSYAYCRYLTFSNANVSKRRSVRYYGLSVRCLRDN